MNEQVNINLNSLACHLRFSSGHCLTNRDKLGTILVSKQLNLMCSYFSFLVIPFKKYKQEKDRYGITAQLFCILFLWLL